MYLTGFQVKLSLSPISNLVLLAPNYYDRIGLYFLSDGGTFSILLTRMTDKWMHTFDELL